MKLQIAPSLTDLDRFIELIKETEEYIDIIEVENIIYYEGAKVLREIKKAFPYKTVLADCKTLYFDELKAMYDNEADIATMSSIADDDEIRKAIDYAHALNKKIQADCTEIDDIEERVSQLEEMGIDIFAMESSVKGEERDFVALKSVERAKSVLKKAEVAIQGGVNLDNIKDVAEHDLEIVICGGAIQKADSPKEAARYIKNIIK